MTTQLLQQGGVRSLTQVGATGYRGWSPIIVTVPDEARSRQVLQLTGWEGGEGAPPASPFYLGDGVLTDDIVQATTIGSSLTPEQMQGYVDICLAAAAAALAAGGGIGGYLVPPFGYDIPALFVTYWAAGSQILADDVNGRRFAANAVQPYLVPRIGDLMNIDMANGIAVSGYDASGYPVPLPPTPAPPSGGDLAYSVPSFGLNLLNVSFGAGSIVAAAGTGANFVGPTASVRDTYPTPWAAIGAPEMRMASAPVTGRSLPQLFMRRSANQAVALTWGPYASALLSSTAAGAATVLRQNTTQSVLWRPTPLGAGGRMVLVLGIGSSRLLGYAEPATSDYIPYWRDNSAERAWMFNSAAIDGVERGPRPLQVSPVAANLGVVIADVQLTQIVPLRGSTHANNGINGQTCLEATAAALLGQHLHPRDHVLVAAVGTGSTYIADFSVNGGVDSAHLTSCKKVIAAAAARAAAMNLSLTVFTVTNIGDQNHPTQSYWVQKWRDMNAAIIAKVGEVGATWGAAIMQQVNQFDGGTGYGTAAPEVTIKAQAELVRAGDCVGVPQWAMLPGIDGLRHFYPLTYLPLGAATAYAIAARLNDAAYNCPFVADGSAVLTSPTTTVCTWANASGAMQFDITTLPNTPDGKYGAAMVDNVGSLALGAMSYAGNQLTVTHAATSLAQAPLIRFGLTGGEAPPPAANGARVNMRDSSGWTCGATGQIISGWPIAHQVPLV